MSRSTWACELKWLFLLYIEQFLRHAPRERVSWNFLNTSFWREKCVTLHVSVWVEIEFEIKHINLPLVTLHVSVWVEMIAIRSLSHFSMVTLHVSVWVEINHTKKPTFSSNVTLHVSVWVEIFKLLPTLENYQSRSTWACELKLVMNKIVAAVKSHAPRERVSWNLTSPTTASKPLSRSTWACELKCYPISLSFLFRWSRSTWACELKLSLCACQLQSPWSRSTWACELKLLWYGKNIQCNHVTLHVSVWVEMV